MATMRDLITIVETASRRSSEYPSRLSDARDIARFVVSMDSEYDESSVMDQYEDCDATLQLLSANQLETEHYHHRSADKERRYAAMPQDTVPPLLVQDGIIIDGNHRFRVGRQRGQKKFWCYVIRRT